MLPDITISGSVLSDLFFNADNPHYSNNNSTSLEEDRKNLLIDAHNFIASLGFPREVRAEDLVEDFMKRL